MQKRNIIFICALLIFSGLVFSPITANADQWDPNLTYGSCKTSKWGVTAKTTFQLRHRPLKAGSNFIYMWGAKVTAWGKGAKVQKRANVALQDRGGRLTAHTYKGWRYKHTRFQVWPEDPVIGVMGIDFYRGRNRHRGRCAVFMYTR